jgi:hypothetical protein
MALGARQYFRDDSSFVFLTRADISGPLFPIDLTSEVTGILPVANGGTGDTGTAWTPYVPVVTANAGVFTSVAATGRYKTLGKTVFVEIEIDITTNGTASGFVLVTLPLTAKAAKYAMFGFRSDAVGLNFAINNTVSVTQALVFKYDGTYPGANATMLIGTGVYEAA